MISKLTLYVYIKYINVYICIYIYVIYIYTYIQFPVFCGSFLHCISPLPSVFPYPSHPRNRLDPATGEQHRPEKSTVDEKLRLCEGYGWVSCWVRDRFTIVSFCWFCYNLFRGRIQPTYIGVIIHLPLVPLGVCHCFFVRTAKVVDWMHLKCSYRKKSWPNNNFGQLTWTLAVRKLFWLIKSIRKPCR